MSNQDANFPNGLIVKRNEQAPEFVICGLSFKTEEFIQWLRENDENGWVNVKVNRSRQGKIYAQKDDWKPTQGSTAPNAYDAPQAPSNPQQTFQNVAPTTGNDPNYSPKDETCPF